MSIRHSLWRVGEATRSLDERVLPTEALRERMFVAALESRLQKKPSLGRTVPPRTAGRRALGPLLQD